MRPDPSNPAKMNQELDIIIPPNFQLFSKEERREDKMSMVLPSKIGKNFPSSVPVLDSSVLDFKNLEMSKIDLEGLLNPHQNDLEYLEKELEIYKHKVEVQTVEFKNLEREKASLRENLRNGVREPSRLYQAQPKVFSNPDSVGAQYTESSQFEHMYSPAQSYNTSPTRVQANMNTGTYQSNVPSHYDDNLTNSPIIQTRVINRVEDNFFDMKPPAPLISSEYSFYHESQRTVPATNQQLMTRVATYDQQYNPPSYQYQLPEKTPVTMNPQYEYSNSRNPLNQPPIPYSTNYYGK